MKDHIARPEQPDLLDALLARGATPGALPPEWVGLASALRSMAGSQTTGPVAAPARADVVPPALLGAMVATVRSGDAPIELASHRRLRVAAATTSAKVIVAGVIVLGGASAAAATGSFPDPVQHVFSKVLGVAGIHVPGGTTSAGGPLGTGASSPNSGSPGPGNSTGRNGGIAGKSGSSASDAGQNPPGSSVSSQQSCGINSTTTTTLAGATGAAGSCPTHGQGYGPGGQGQGGGTGGGKGSGNSGSSSPNSGKHNGQKKQSSSAGTDPGQSTTTIPTSGVGGASGVSGGPGSTGTNAPSHGHSSSHNS